MESFITFEKRFKGQQEEPEVFIYGKLSPALRVQITHIWEAALGNAGLKGEFRSRKPCV